MNRLAVDLAMKMQRKEKNRLGSINEERIRTPSRRE
jgi:hypothetical protein